MKLNFIETTYFKKQLEELNKKFIKLNLDWDNFKTTFDTRFGIELGGGIYKFRLRNSSIPTGKSGGFRVILKIHSHTILPINIFSKTEKSNISKNEIINSMEKVLEEL